VTAHAVRIGCSGWQYRSWRGVLYPEGLAQRRWLEHYARSFDTVEVNATFYRLASREAVAGWVEQTPPGFIFALKASRYLIHMKKLRDIEPGIRRFYERIEPLVGTPKLGPVLWQLPGWFTRDDERLAGALALLPPGRHAFEFRHPSWFVPEVAQLLRRHGVALAVGDHPSRPFQALELTADFTFIRFHHGARGRRGNYSQRELDAWAERIAGLRERAEVFAYFNNDWEGFAVRNARTLRRRVDVYTGRSLGTAIAMDQENEKIFDTTKEHRPLSETASRTRPPANPPRDEEDVRKGEEKLEQAGAGH
jgi:uncharacterized protein YecE (DUF72 family)